jgi:hypothetical protein
MTDRNWYVAMIDGKQHGPYSDDRLRELVAGGTVEAETPVWCDGMSDWTKAAEIPGLVPQSLRPPPLPLPVRASAPKQNGSRAFSTTITPWPLFGRTLLVVVSQLLVVPTPWAVTSFCQWFVDHLQVPDRPRVAFTGRAGDIWYIFILSALCGYVGFVEFALQLATLPLGVLFLVIIGRWFFRNLAWQGQVAPLKFTAGYWAMLGWYVLFTLSAITVVGWAWALAAWTRWMCRHVEGSAKRLIFTASGWGVLWRTLLFALSLLLIIPIPWTFRWYTSWVVSQFALSSEGGAEKEPTFVLPGMGTDAKVSQQEKQAKVMVIDEAARANQRTAFDLSGMQDLSDHKFSQGDTLKSAVPSSAAITGQAFTKKGLLIGGLVIGAIIVAIALFQFEGTDLHLKVEVNTTRVGNLLSIQNVDHRPITIQSLTINDRSDCKLMLMGTTAPIAGTTPLFEKLTLNIGDAVSWLSNCNIIRVSVETDRGSEMYSFGE